MESEPIVLNEEEAASLDSFQLIKIKLNCSILKPVDYLQSCIESKEELVGAALGVTAVIVALATHITLLVVRHRQQLQRPHPTYTPVLHDFLAHACDCTGAILTKQTFFQVSYVVILLGCDVLSSFQHVIILLDRYCDGRGNAGQRYVALPQRRGSVQIRSVLFPFGLTCILLMSFQFLSSGHFMSSVPDNSLNIYPFTHSRQNRVLLSNDNVKSRPSSRSQVFIINISSDTYKNSVVPTLGFVIAGVGVLFYWLTRLPSIQAVFRERYICRVQYALHWQFVLCNILYCSTLLHGVTSMDAFLSSLPWSIGRMAMLGCDIGLLIQIHINEKSRNLGKEINKKVASLLRNQLSPSSSSGLKRDDSIQDQDATWVPLKPIKNRYLQKMSKIAKHIDNQLSDPENSGNDSGSADDTKALLKPYSKPIYRSDAIPLFPLQLNKKEPNKAVTSVSATDISETSASDDANPTDSETELSRISERYMRDPGTRLRTHDIKRILAQEERHIKAASVNGGMSQHNGTRDAPAGSLCWSGTEDFFELNEEEINSILEAEDQVREGCPKLRPPSITSTNDVNGITWDERDPLGVEKNAMTWDPLGVEIISTKTIDFNHYQSRDHLWHP